MLARKLIFSISVSRSEKMTMIQARRVVVPQPVLDLHKVQEAVFRYAAHRDQALHSGVVAIATESAENPHAVQGPEGFRLRLFECRSTAAPIGYSVDSEQVLLVVVASGSLAISTSSTMGEVTELQQRDAVLFPVGSEFWMQACGGSDAQVVVIQFAVQEPSWRKRWTTILKKDVQKPIVQRFFDLDVLRERRPLRWLPAPLYALLSPRDLYPLLGPVAFGPGRFAVQGPDKLVVVMATTPPATGPALHVHQLSTEMFLVLEGRYRITWGDSGEHATELGPMDAIVIPTGVSRAFEALGPGPDWILPMVVGCNDETKDIVWLEDIEQRVQALLPWPIVEVARRSVMRFGTRAR
jgi:mannose-6-phosphate isomerase-like protein (cupin superfamily)